MTYILLYLQWFEGCSRHSQNGKLCVNCLQTAKKRTMIQERATRCKDCGLLILATIPGIEPGLLVDLLVRTIDPRNVLV